MPLNCKRSSAPNACALVVAIAVLLVLGCAAEPRYTNAAYAPLRNGWGEGAHPADQMVAAMGFRLIMGIGTERAWQRSYTKAGSDQIIAIYGTYGRKREPVVRGRIVGRQPAVDRDVLGPRLTGVATFNWSSFTYQKRDSDYCIVVYSTTRGKGEPDFEAWMDEELAIGGPGE